MNTQYILLDNTERYLINSDQYDRFKYELLKHMKSSLHSNFKIYETFQINETKDSECVRFSALRESYEADQLLITIDSKINLEPKFQCFSVFKESMELFYDMYLIQIETLKKPLWLTKCLYDNDIETDSFITYNLIYKNNVLDERRQGLIYI